MHWVPIGSCALMCCLWVADRWLCYSCHVIVFGNLYYVPWLSFLMEKMKCSFETLFFLIFYFPLLPCWDFFRLHVLLTWTSFYYCMYIPFIRRRRFSTRTYISRRLWNMLESQWPTWSLLLPLRYILILPVIISIPVHKNGPTNMLTQEIDWSTLLWRCSVLVIHFFFFLLQIPFSFEDRLNLLFGE